MIKITDLFPVLKPGWVVMDSDGYWIWFEKKPSLVETYWIKVNNPDITDEDFYYYFDDMKDKPEDVPDEDVSVDYVWKAENSNRVNISDCNILGAFKDIEPAQDWKQSLLKVG